MGVMPTRSRQLPRSFAATVALVAAAALGPLPGCKSGAQKVTLGPFTVDRYEEKAVDGARLDCYVFGGDSNKPARLCGDGQPTPGFSGFLFNAVTPAPGRFTDPGAPGWYILRPAGETAVDTWSLGPRLPTREWLGGGKALLGVETGPDHHTRVRLIDPQTRSDRVFDAGLHRADSFLLVRAPGDAHILLVQRLGGDELILVRDPMGNPELFVSDASEEKSPGSKRFRRRGDLARLNGGTFIPSSADLGNITWKGDTPLYEGAPMGPFDSPRTG
jgi:hypothetical protein